MIRSVLVVLITAFLGVQVAVSQESSVRAGVSHLENELKAVKADIKQHYEQISKKGAEFVQFKSGVVREKTDDAAQIKSLYAEITAMERKLLGKRRQLDDLVQQHPKGRQIAQERVELYKEVSGLRATEKAIENEIKLARKVAEPSLRKNK